MPLHLDESFLNLFPTAVYVCDASGVITYFNRGAEDLWGRRPAPGDAEDRFCGSYRLFRTDGTPLSRAETPMACVLSTGEPVRGTEAVVERPDGTRVPVLANAVPLRNGDGRLVGGMTSIVDLSALKENERALAARTQELEAVLAAVPAVVWVAHDPECRRITGSRVAAEFLRMPPASNMSKTAPGDQAPRHFRVFDIEGREIAGPDLPVQMAARGREVRGVEVKTVFDDGTARILYGNAVPLRNPDATPRGSVAAFIDVTERKQAEEELGDFFENAAVGCHWVGPDGTILRANATELRMLGYAREEYVGRNIAEFHVDRPVIEEILARLWRNETLRAFPARMQARDGSVRDVLIDSSVLWRAGKFVHTRCFTRDVTDQRRAESSLAFLAEASELLVSSLDTEATLRRLAELAVPRLADWCAIFMQAPDGTVRNLAIRHSDPARLQKVRELLERYRPDPEAAYGHRYVIRTGRSQLVPQVTEEVLRAVARDEEHLRLLREAGFRSGMVVPLAAQGRTLGALSLVSAESGRVYGPADLRLAEELGRRTAVAVVNAELYEKARQAEVEVRSLNADLERRVRERTTSLEELVKELDTFAYTVAHDLRAPLRAIHGFGQMLQEDLGAKLEGEGRRYLVQMVRAAGRMDSLIRDLLEYSRLSRDRIELEPLALQPLVDAVVDEMRDELAARKAEVRVERPLPSVRGHAVMLRQAVTNLLSNAVKFVRPQTLPQVRVRAEERDGRVRLWVEDNGIGIAPEYQDRLFRVFERLHGPDAYPGTGIGLAIVRRAVERMGGSAGLESEPDKGSRFYVELEAASLG